MTKFKNSKNLAKYNNIRNLAKYKNLKNSFKFKNIEFVVKNIKVLEKLRFLNFKAGLIFI